MNLIIESYPFILFWSESKGPTDDWKASSFTFSTFEKKRYHQGQDKVQFSCLSFDVPC